MCADKRYYTEHLYPLQDRVLALVATLETGFYLTGGTALSRVYLHHRYSDDLDLFVNYDPQFGDWCGRIIGSLSLQPAWQLQVVLRQQYFARLLVTDHDTVLKVEMVNDVPSHVGELRQYPVIGCVDSPENILANKLTALISRDEPRDLADVWGLYTKLGLSIHAAIEGATSKATGIYPVDLAQRLCTATRKDWEQVRWIDPPEVTRYLAELNALGEALIIV